MTALAWMAAVCFAQGLWDGQVLAVRDLVVLAEAAAGVVTGDPAVEVAEVPAAAKTLPTSVPCVGWAFVRPLLLPSTSN